MWLAFLSAILYLATLISSAEGFFHEKKEKASVSESHSKALGIERPAKTVVAPDFTLEELSGRRLRLKDLRGKVVFLNFWATWCVPCREEMPTMERLHREFKEQGLEIVAINFREGRKEVRKFLVELGLTFTVLLDRDGTVSERYGAWAIPLSYFVNRRGEFVGKAQGSRKWDGAEAKAFFRNLLAENETGT